MNEHLRLGDAAMAEGHYAQALSAYAHAHELAPTDAHVQRAQMRARVYLMANHPARVSQDALEDITYEASFLQNTEPTLQVVCLTALGQVLARRGDIEGAKAKLAEAIKADGQSPVPHIALGMVSMNEPGGLATAKIEFELALQHKPDSTAALVGLGQLKLAEGDIAGAIDKLEAAARREDDLPVRLALGTAHLREGKHAEAARELRRALVFDPKNPDTQSALGQAMLGLGQLEEAEELLTASNQSHHDQATAISLGFTLVRLNQSERALSIFRRVLGQDPNAAPALLGSGMANEQLARPKEAIAFYRQLLAIPAGGPQKGAVVELQKEAQGRLNTLTQETTAPTAPATTGTLPPPKPAPGQELLNGRN
jgi:Flp pilus assembly protein TadD